MESAASAEGDGELERLEWSIAGSAPLFILCVRSAQHSANNCIANTAASAGDFTGGRSSGALGFKLN